MQNISSSHAPELQYLVCDVAGEFGVKWSLPNDNFPGK